MCNISVHIARVLPCVAQNTANNQVIPSVIADYKVVSRNKVRWEQEITEENKRI
jgi:hypothetical protein